MKLDGIIISDYGHDSLSATNSMRLKIGEEVANIQAVLSFLNDGCAISNDLGKGQPRWDAAPKLNGIFLLSFLLSRGYSFELINNFKAEKEKIRSLVDKKPKFVLISTTFIYRKKDLRNLVNEVRELFGDTTIIVGGAFVYSSYLLREKANKGGYRIEEAANDYLFLKDDNEPPVDFYVISPRGEYVLLALLEQIVDGGNFEDIANISFLKKGGYYFAPMRAEICRGEHLALDWGGLPEKIFSAKVVPVQASNGCTYNCSFCNFTKDKNINCIKPLDILLDELKQIQQKGVEYVWFSDDNFRLGKKDLNLFCQRLLEERISLKWMSFVRASTLKDVDFQLLKNAGCVEVQLGVESGSPFILENMNKIATPDLYKAVIKKILSSGIDCSCYFIVGFPGETEETVLETLKFIQEIERYDGEGCLSWSIFPFILSPLSPIYEEKERIKYELSGYMHKWQHKTMNYETAQSLIKKLFLSLECSAPIYRGDSLHCLSELNNEDKKKFFYARHQLTKAFLQNSSIEFEKEIKEVFKFLNYEN